MFDEVRRFGRDIKIGMFNLTKWLPIIWQDRDWDSEYIIRLLQFKLSNMEDFIRYKGHHLYAERDADTIHRALLYIDRILNYDHHSNIFKHHDKKWGEVEISTEDIDNSDSCKVLLKRQNVKTEKDEELERKEFRILTEKVYVLEQQDYDMLFKHLKKYIRTWWD
jgi:hypothetical protein